MTDAHYTASTLITEISELRNKLAEAEKNELEAIQERDKWEEWCTQMAILGGCEEEWSNFHDHRECVDAALSKAGEVEQRVNEVESTVASLTKKLVQKDIDFIELEKSETERKALVERIIKWADECICDPETRNHRDLYEEACKNYWDAQKD